MKLRISLPFITALASAMSPSIAFQTSSNQRHTARTATSLTYSTWDAFEMPDNLELMMGGTRYEMVELPDSMMSTTLWVGNLCEFVTDEMLGEIFQQASSLKSVPACVARKPNFESLRYGFVTFPSEEEKEVSSCINISPLEFVFHHCSHHTALSQDCHELTPRIRNQWKMHQGRVHQRPRKARPH